LRSVRHRLDESALGSFHGSRRVLQFLQWVVPSGARLAGRVARAAPRHLEAIEGGSVRALLEQRLLPLASGVDAAFVALLAAHVPLVHDAALAFDCLVDRFGKPLHRFNALAPLDARLSSRRNAIVSRTRAQVCYVLDSWLLHYASDFLAGSELFADWRSCWCSAPTFADSLDDAAVSPQAVSADQGNAQVLRRRARSGEEPHAARLPPGRGRAADGAGGAL
jgi:hypothetical protein